MTAALFVLATVLTLWIGIMRLAMGVPAVPYFGLALVFALLAHINSRNNTSA